MEENNKEEIKLEDVKFPSDFKFEQTSNGFKVNTETGGEFFPNKANIFGYLFLASFLFSIFGPLYFGSTKYYDESIKNILCIGSFFSVFFMLAIFIFIGKITSIKTEYIYSVNGIKVTSKKGTLFIPKSNIKDIQLKKLISNGCESYEYYNIYIELKKALYIPYTKKYKERINLFLDHQFKEENTARFLFQQLDKTFDLNYVDNYFEEINEEEKNISINEIQLPKDLNYQQINNTLKFTSGGGSLFPENIFFKFLYIFFIFVIICTIYIVIIFNLPKLITLPFFDILGAFHGFAFFIILPIIFSIPIILVSIISKIITKNTMPKANYIFSIDGINIILKKELISIPKENIDYIDIENDSGNLTTSNNGTQLYYKIILNLKEPLYTKFNSIVELEKLEKNISKKDNIQKTVEVFNVLVTSSRKDLKSKVEKVQLLDKFKDKKVARFLVKEMKKILQID